MKERHGKAHNNYTTEHNVFCPEGNVSFSSYWAKWFNMRAAGTMAFWDLLQSLINIWSGAETDRDNGPYCPEICAADIRATDRRRKGEYLHCLFLHRIVHKDSMLTMKWHSHCTEDMEKGIDGSCWHCYQNVCARVCVWFKDGSNIPLTSVTSSAHICCFAFYKNSDTVVRATAASRPQPTQHILTLCACESVRAARFNILRWWQDFESST